MLPLSGTWGKDKESYVRFLNAMRTEGAWGGDTVDLAAHHIAQTASDAAVGAFSIAAAVHKLEEEIRERVGHAFRSDSVAHQIVQDVSIGLGVTADGVARRHRVDSVAALRALARMEELGILKRRAAQRPHVFYSAQMLRLVERFSAQIPKGDGGKLSMDSQVESVSVVVRRVTKISLADESAAGRGCPGPEHNVRCHEVMLDGLTRDIASNKCRFLVYRASETKLLRSRT